MKTKFICLYGETCAGKSTLGKELGSLLGCPYISFGDTKRDEIRQNTELGSQLKQILDEEKPIPAELSYEVIRDNICVDGENIISGYPVSNDELSVLTKYGFVLGIVVLDIDEQNLLSRFYSRVECPICHLSGRNGDCCLQHSMKMVKREDVTENELAKRRRLYSQKVQPFLDTNLSSFPNLSIKVGTLHKHELTKIVFGWYSNLKSEIKQERSS